MTELKKQFYVLNSRLLVGPLMAIGGIVLIFAIPMIRARTTTDLVIAVVVMFIGVMLMITGKKKMNYYKELAEGTLINSTGKVTRGLSGKRHNSFKINYNVDGEEFDFRIDVAKYSKQSKFLKQNETVEVLIPASDKNVCFVKEIVEGTL